MLSDEAVFGDMVMVEASRGCQWGCRFCAAGFMYRPIRTRDPEQLARAPSTPGSSERATIGLVGAEMASVPGRRRAEPSSPRRAAAACRRRRSRPTASRRASPPRSPRGGTRSVTVAPEAGSERMRRVINKNLSEADILRAAELLVGEGVQQLKLYFMIGLPTETDEDVLAIAALAERIRARLAGGARERRRVGSVTVSLNAVRAQAVDAVPVGSDGLDPEPARQGAAAQARAAAACPTCSSTSSRRAKRICRRSCRAAIAASRASSRPCTPPTATGGASSAPGSATASPALPHPDAYVHRTYGETERLPWDFIDHRIAKCYLWVERRKALRGAPDRAVRHGDVSSCAAC